MNIPSFLNFIETILWFLIKYVKNKTVIFKLDDLDGVL